MIGGIGGLVWMPSRVPTMEQQQTVKAMVNHFQQLFAKKQRGRALFIPQ